MSEHYTIVFLYSPRYVPQQIIDMATARVPANFSLELLEQDAPAELRHEKISQADFLLGYPGNPSKQEIAAAGRLKLFQVLSAGYEWLDLAAFQQAGIPIANNGGANAPTVAEHALLLILAVYKKLPFHHDSLHQGRWLGLQETLRMREFRAKTLGIVGFGRIGRQLARLASGFEATIRYYDAVRAPAEVEQELGAVALPFDELLAQADVVSVHTPLTDHTQGLINARAFGLMKASAILINTSRGPVVDEPALIEALRNKQIAGAGLDVFSTEPMPTDSPLLSLDNVVVTPHIAGVTLDTWARRISFGFANIQRVAAGQAPESVIGGGEG